MLDGRTCFPLIALFAAPIAAQTWTPHRPVVSPSARDASPLAYDAVRDRFVMFGGWAGSPLADTWELDGRTWIRMQPTTKSPPARHGHVLVFDPISSKTLLFGGAGAGRLYLSDTWLWDGTKRSWTEVHTSAQPSPRTSMGVAFYEAGKRVLAYGGQIKTSASSWTFFADMWSWNGSRWTRELASSPPQRRSQMGFAYDSLRRKVVMVGGHSYPTRRFHRDTWEFDGTWKRVHLHSFPTDRAGPALAFVPRTGRMILYGGNADGPALNDCWSYGGGTWTKVATPTSLAARGWASIATDTKRGTTVLFGGRGKNGGLADTWSYGDRPPPTFVIHGTACGSRIPRPAIAAAVPPWHSERFRIDVRNVPSAAPVLLALGATARVPLPLDALGAPNCRAYFDVLSPLLLLPLTAQQGIARFEAVLPAALTGAIFEAQGLVFDRRANALGIAFSDGGTGTIR